MKTIVGIVLLTAMIGGLYALNSATKTEQGKSILHVAEPLPVTVEVATPQRRRIVRTVQAPGDVEPFHEVAISAEVVAKILEMPVKEGESVSEGQLLCRLDDADYRARVASAEANVAKLKALVIQAEADLEKADRDSKRQMRLSENDATSALELADYHTILVRSRAALEVRRQELIETEAMLQSAREDLEKTVITAPIDGVISQLFAKQGEVVITGTMNNPGTRIMVVSDLSKMQVRSRVDESDAALVKPDQVARIYLQSDSKEFISGHVLRVGAKGTKAQGRDVVTFETLVVVDRNDARVKPGMTASVDIEVDLREDAITIPVQAVVHRKRQELPEDLVKTFEAETGKTDRTTERRGVAEYLKVVFCIENDVAKPHLVETGIGDATGVEITRGLSGDARFATGPYRSLDQLKDGAKIKTATDAKKKDEVKEAPVEAQAEKTEEKQEGEALAENRG